MTYNDFLKIVRDSIKAVKAIKFHCYGSTDVLNEVVKSEIKYPAAWFSFPDIEEVNTSVQETWSFAIIVFENQANKDYVALEKIHNTTLDLLRKVVSNLREKAINSEILDLGEMVKYNTIFPKTVDNIQGWQAEIEIISNRCLE